MSWPEQPVGEVCSFITSGGTPSTKREEFYGGNIPWLRTQEITFKPIWDTEIKITEEGLKRSAVKWIPENSVIVAMYGASAGRVAINKIPLTTNQACCNLVIDPKKGDYRYVFYALRNRFGSLESLAKGAAQRNLNAGQVKLFPIPSPTIEIQRRIADFLAAYDDLIENNRRRIQLMEQAARLLYKEWFVHLRFPGHEHTRIIDGVPEGWKKKRLGDVVATNAESYKANNLPTEINYIDISSVKQSRILSKNKMLSSEAPGRARRIGADGDIIWSNVRPNLRAYALVLEPDDNDVFSTGFTILSPVAIPFSYLYLFATTDEFVGHLVNHTTGASYPAVRPADFERAEILLPAQSVLSIFHEKLEPALRMIQVLQKEINALARARDLLLPKLMNGEVTV
jgi:type I restriction enzyme S subunit